MKLYTEEEVINFAISMISQYEFGNKNILNKELLKESLDCITPIELPSNEEIKEFVKNEIGLEHPFAKHHFMYAIKWLKDKIQGGNNDKVDL